LFRKSNENAPGALKNAIHPEKKEAASSFQNEQARSEVQKQKDKSVKQRILRGLGKNSASTKKPSHKQVRNDAPINVRPQVSVSDFPTSTLNRASKPYTPIIVHQLVHSGAQKKISISGTNYAKQAADRLINENGKLDRTHIVAMLNELKVDAMRPPEQQMLSDFHRKHVSNTLSALLEDDKLVNIINQTCKHKPLRGAAADLVQATLNIPPQQTDLGKVEARKAVVMSLLGNLRQGQVGSCFATGSAIAVHREAPRVVASELKELLENNSMMMKGDKAKTQVPLNKHISRASAQIKLLVRSDGAYFGKASGTPEAPYWLHETPGMAAALTALGIPEQEQQYYVSMSLQNMNVQGNDLHGVSPQQIIECLAHATDGKGLLPEQRIAAALNAFSGAEDVRLLHAWEYTLATHASSSSSWRTLQNIRAAVWSLASEASDGFVKNLSSEPRFQSTLLSVLNKELLNDVLRLMQKRFFLQYDADVEQDGIAADGVSSGGGHVLYSRVPPDDPSQWQRIDTPEMFREAVTRLIEDAAQKTRPKAAHLVGKTVVNQQAVDCLADNLKQYIGNDDFADQAALRFNSYRKKDNVDPFYLPWKQVEGGIPTPIMEHYGSTLLPASNISPVKPASTTDDDGNGSTQTGKADASSLLYFLLDAQISMGTKLQKKAKMLKSEFYVPLVNERHGYSAIPTEMAEVWQHADQRKNLTSQQWVHKHLVQPAQAYLDKKRTTPQLYGLLQSMHGDLEQSPEKMDELYKLVSEKCEFRGGQQVYNLRDVYEVLIEQAAGEPCEAAWRDAVGTLLANKVPSPPEMTKRIADFNWEQENGSPIYLGVKHNPFTNKIEANFIDDKGKYLGEVGEDWLFGQQKVGTPLARGG